MKMGIDVRDEQFKDWLKQTEHRFIGMIETMKNVALVIRENVLPITPFDTGRLSNSFNWKVVTDNSRMKVLQISMSAINPKDGYNYAWIQHENLDYSHGFTHHFLSNRAGGKYYNDDMHFGNYNYSANVGGGSYQEHIGKAKFLETGVRNSMDMVIEILEGDYLSLFTGGSVVGANIGKSESILFNGDFI